MVVSNTGGSITSSSATLTVDPVPQPPTIITQPVSQTVNEGDPVTFTVVASGTDPLTYQWRRNGVDMPGETNASLTLATTTPADSGDQFSVAVSNGLGSATSAPATLTVNVIPPDPEITITRAECGPASGAFVDGITQGIAEGSEVVLSSGPNSVTVTVTGGVFSFAVPGPIAGCPPTVTASFGSASTTTSLTGIP